MVLLSQLNQKRRNKMNTQEREIRLLNKILESQEETIKIYQESIVPMLEIRIKNLEEQLNVQ